jgi:hypothetical protein
MTDQITSSLCILKLQQGGNGAKTIGDGREKVDARDLRFTTFSLSSTFGKHAAGLELRPTRMKV